MTQYCSVMCVCSELAQWTIAFYTPALELYKQFKQRVEFAVVGVKCISAFRISD